jgi:putative transcriptional regulator
MNSLQGRCLIAAPSLEDVNFYRAVVYIIRHNENEALGVVINRPTMLALSEIVDMVCQAECQREDYLYLGGPVEGSLMVVHDRRELADLECGPGVYLTTGEDFLIRVVTDSSARIRVLENYSGWGPGQLEYELQWGNWLVSDIEPSDLFGDPSDLWERMLKAVGHDIIAVAISPHGIPINPGRN